MYHAWLQPAAAHRTHAAAAALPTGQPKSKRVLQGEFLPTKVTEGNMGRKTVVLNLNTPEHCLKPCLLTSPDSTTVSRHSKPRVWSHSWFSQLCSLFSTTTSYHLWSPPHPSNAPNLAHANPDPFLCLHGLQDGQETARVAARLEWHLCWKAWQCRSGTSSVSHC